jgi:hypothetical protein
MTRRNRDEIIELLRACQIKLGRVPGHAAFGKETGVKLSEINYYWPTFNKLLEEVSGKTNEFVARLPDDVVWGLGLGLLQRPFPNAPPFGRGFLLRGNPVIRG